MCCIRRASRNRLVHISRCNTSLTELIAATLVSWIDGLRDVLLFIIQSVVVCIAKVLNYHLKVIINGIFTS